MEDLGSIPGFGRSSGGENGYPLQYSGLENSMDCVFHGVTKSWTWLSNSHFSCIYIYKHIKFLCMYKFYIYRLCHRACGILVPWPGIEPTRCTVKVWSPNHWTVREFPISFKMATFSVSLYCSIPFSLPLMIPFFFNMENLNLCDSWERRIMNSHGSINQPHRLSWFCQSHLSALHPSLCFSLHAGIY